MTGGFVARFEARTVKTDGCWFWVGGLNAQGYGQMSVMGRQVGAHRIAWELYRGEIPPTLTIDHLCRNPLCVNPDHMEIVTSAENKSRSRRVTPLRGLRYDLTTSPVARRRVELGLSRRELAELSGVSEPTVVNLELGKHRPHFSTLQKVASALSVDPTELLDSWEVAS